MSVIIVDSIEAGYQRARAILTKEMDGRTEVMKEEERALAKEQES